MEAAPAKSSNEAPIQVPRYSYYALSILTLVNFLNYIDRQMVPAVATSMQSDLHLSDTELGAMEAALLVSFTVLAPLFFKQKTAYELGLGIPAEPLFRSYR